MKDETKSVDEFYAVDDKVKLPRDVSREEFESEYVESSDISIEMYRRTQVTMKCNCGEDICNGWAAVSNNPLSIKAHKDNYG